jgi:hypothetical protein
MLVSKEQQDSRLKYTFKVIFTVCVSPNDVANVATVAVPYGRQQLQLKTPTFALVEVRDACLERRESLCFVPYLQGNCLENVIQPGFLAVIKVLYRHL